MSDNPAHKPTANAETGSWDEDGYLAPWPQDIDDWRPWHPPPHTPEPGQPPF